MDNLDLSSLIKCEICNQIFENPVILPCAKTVCLKHTFSQVVNGKHKCDLCNQLHQIPENSFPRDVKTTKLIEINSELNFGENNFKAKKECEFLDDLINQSECLIQEPVSFINDYFSCLKYKINLKKQEFIAVIEENYDKVIKEIVKFEIKCKLEAKNKMTDFNDALTTSKLKLDAWIKELKVPNFSKDKQWKNISLKSKQETERVKYLLANFQNELLLYKDYKFQPKQIIDNNNFGEFLTEDIERIEENRSEAKFQLVINDFSSFIEKGDLRESIDYCLIRKIPWRLRAVIHKNKDFDNALGFGFYPDIELKKLKSNPINTEVRMRVAQKENFHFKKDLVRHFNHRFDKNQASGDPYFVLLKDIMDQSNGIYDEANDSITLEALVKVLNI